MCVCVCVYIYTPHLFLSVHLLMDTLIASMLLAITNNTARNTGIQSFARTYVFNSVGYITRSRIAASYGNSSILAWKTPWTEEPGRLQSMGSQSQT